VTPELTARAKAAMSRDGKPRGDHMIEVFAMMAKAAKAPGDEEQEALADIYDLASRCIANETAMFDGLVAVVRDASR
jgi:hypothetical protein